MKSRLLSLPARVGGPGFTFIRDKRDNPLESTKGNYFTLDGFVSSEIFRVRSGLWTGPGQFSTYYAFGGRGKVGHQWVFARSTSIGMQQPVNGTRVLPPGSCPPNATGESTCTDITTDPAARTILYGRWQLASRIRVKSGRTPRSIVRISCRRYGPVCQQPGTSLPSD